MKTLKTKHYGEYVDIEPKEITNHENSEKQLGGEIWYN